jgi:hypothetical protein
MPYASVAVNAMFGANLGSLSRHAPATNGSRLRLWDTHRQHGGPICDLRLTLIGQRVAAEPLSRLFVATVSSAAIRNSAVKCRRPRRLADSAPSVRGALYWGRKHPRTSGCLAWGQLARLVPL